MLIMRVSGAIARGILIFKTSLRLHRDRAALSLMAAEFQRTKVLKAVYSGSVWTADENIEAKIGAGARQTHVYSARNCSARGSNNVLSEICKQADACVEVKSRSDKGLGPHRGTHEIGLQRKIPAKARCAERSSPTRRTVRPFPLPHAPCRRQKYVGPRWQSYISTDKQSNQLLLLAGKRTGCAHRHTKFFLRHRMQTSVTHLKLGRET